MKRFDVRVLVTGAAGFIGAAVSQALLDRGDDVIGLDSVNAYYSRDLKRYRLAKLSTHARFEFHTQD